MPNQPAISVAQWEQKLTTLAFVLSPVEHHNILWMQLAAVTQDIDVPGHSRRLKSTVYLIQLFLF